ncbi:STE/STE7 protein kinase Wis1 [Schizosaccharomyces japonicus yFS275]|uniref:mitogen-activated protein kinase kinase n=1 Tax=Schizosaccharomyces japonicus (strain yFS275 / FY16936) TaxID=402676 RepID=B6K276_SCHJY|nr:STE/STE7 protein kinase Wis1 [Schizosaccharomyces japonicus yFS275]EEB07257.1 STE/STE7 protein kinase Wis1 [Schizosaccharomyces japonicus yFS275]
MNYSESDLLTHKFNTLGLSETQDSSSTSTSSSSDEILEKETSPYAASHEANPLPSVDELSTSPTSVRPHVTTRRTSSYKTKDLPNAIPSVRIGRSSSQRLQQLHGGGSVHAINHGNAGLSSRSPPDYNGRPTSSVPPSSNSLATSPTSSSSFRLSGSLSTGLQEKLRAFHASRSRSLPDTSMDTASVFSPSLSPNVPPLLSQPPRITSSSSVPALDTSRFSNAPGVVTAPETTLARSIAAARNPAQRNTQPSNISAPRPGTMRRRGPPGRLDLSTPNNPVAMPSKSMAARRGIKLSNVPTPRAPNETPFSAFSDILDAKSGSLNFKNKAILNSEGVNFSSGSSFKINMSELIKLDELGKGNYGVVYKVLHRPTGVKMALKEIRLSLDEATFNQIIMELDILHKATSPYIVEFYGAFFVEGSVFICMEFMDAGSMDKLYTGGIEDEGVLARITYAIVQGLKTLKEEQNIIHRDVKPTNVLMNTAGQVKLCDFGVSGNLVASISKTNIGCQSYMAPERIRAENAGQLTYTVQADIWSLGLSILEMAKGAYPYPPDTFNSIFAQLSAICDGEPPSLPADKYSPEAIDFVKRCLNKDPSRRPSYAQLAIHPWLEKYQKVPVDMAAWVKGAMERRNSASGKADTFKPPLHKFTMDEKKNTGLL